MQGITAARICRNQGLQCSLIDRAGAIGGMMKPVEMAGTCIDPGCQLWDARDTDNVSFMRSNLDLELVPIAGHIESSVSHDGVLRRKLPVPSFEGLPDEIRLAATASATSVDSEPDPGASMQASLQEIFGRDIAGQLAASAAKMYGKPVEWLSMAAAAPMGFTRIKLHRCDELERMLDGDDDLGSFLCSDPLHRKADDVIKYYYPVGGLQAYLSRTGEWLQSELTDVLLNEVPVSIEIPRTERAGVLRTKNAIVEFENMLWCCNPLALAKFLGHPRPPREKTAPSPFKAFFFAVRGNGIRTEFIHDYRPDSPVFRTWIPPAEMLPDLSGERHVIVECPGARNDAALISQIIEHVRRVHSLDGAEVHYLGSHAEARFYPTTDYIRWLRQFVERIHLDWPGVLLPKEPQFGRSTIADWWQTSLSVLPTR